MLRSKRMSASLRGLLSDGETHQLPGVFSALSARIAEQAGFEAVAVSGYAVSAHLLAKPDVGLITMSEIVQVAGYVADAVGVPVIADADTGFGNAINCMRATEAFIKAGVAGIHIEDQVAPKRCGHVAGKEIVSIAEAAGKLRAAARTRDALDPDFVLIARTDARGVAGGSVAEAIRRCHAYLEAGADILFPEGLTSAEELERVSEAVRAPILYNRTGISPNLPAAELRRLRIALVANAGGASRAAARAMWDYLHAFRAEDHRLEERLGSELSGHPVADFHTFIGFPEIRRLEEEFLPAEDVARKYAASLGFAP